MKKNNYLTTLLTLTLSTFTLSALAMTPNLETDIYHSPTINIEDVFNKDVVGINSAGFVDPIAECERHNGKATDLDGNVTNIKIDCYQFPMGTAYTETGNEIQHQVRFSKNYEIQKTEVTQLQWLIVMSGTDNIAPSYFNYDDIGFCNGNRYPYYDYSSHLIVDKSGLFETYTICTNQPVERVSYNDIMGKNGFLERLNASQDHYTYSLPTEAQWEYAARGGLYYIEDGKIIYPAYSFEDTSYWSTRTYVHYSENTQSMMRNVSTLKPNGYGIFDMYGNAEELTSDFYDTRYGLSFSELDGVVTDPTTSAEPRSSDRLSLRGGSVYTSYVKHTADRGNRISPTSSSPYVGFRLVRVPRKKD